MELITPAYSFNNLAVDICQLSLVAGASYVIGYNISYRVLMWWYRRQRG